MQQALEQLARLYHSVSVYLAITASMSDPIEPVRIEEILAIARRHVVERVRLFGSLARGDSGGHAE